MALTDEDRAMLERRMLAAQRQVPQKTDTSLVLRMDGPVPLPPIDHNEALGAIAQAVAAIPRSEPVVPIDHNESLAEIAKAVGSINADKLIAVVKTLAGTPKAIVDLADKIQSIATSVGKIQGVDIKPLVSALDKIASEMARNTAEVKKMTVAYSAPRRLLIDRTGDILGAEPGLPEGWQN